MKTKTRLHVLAICIILALLYQFRTGTRSLNNISKLNPMNYMLEMIQSDASINSQEQRKHVYDHNDYSDFQLLNDNMTYVHTGYYDDREVETVVKVIAMIHRKVSHNFTCTVHYLDQTLVEVTGYVQKHFAYAVAGFIERYRYRNGYIICPVSREYGPPTSVSLIKEESISQKTNVIVRPPPKNKNNLTRCISPFVKNYDDVSQLISNIELFRIFGVDKHILYMCSQTPRLVDVVRSYAKDGMVEIRNFSISKSVKLFDEFRKGIVYWAQWSAYHDCILSSMYSSKYVMIVDVDEVIVPRKHKTILELADDLLVRSERDPIPAGALIFRNVYFPTFKNITSKDFPKKDVALKYNIHPLLYTTRFKTSDNPYNSPKSLVRPETVERMFIHYVDKFKKGWKNKIVDEDVAIMHHYRGIKSEYMLPPETEDEYVLQFSRQLTSTVKEQFEKMFNK